MKKSAITLTFAMLLTLSSGAQALELMVLNDYNGAGDSTIWKKAKTDQIPQVLLSQVTTGAPTSAYGQVFPKTFMQESLFAVCFRSCTEADIFKIVNGEMSSKDRAKSDVIEQSNVYFWLGKYFQFVNTGLQYDFKHFLKVITDRRLKDETRGKVMKNNAFFNPKDISLSFLPASNNLLFKLMGGKINRSGFDPSVIAHEASHYLFHHLYPDSVNDEIAGLNEGFADYVANAFLGNPKVGLVMMHGKALRDSSMMVDKDGKPKVYAPQLESHDLGERVAYVLWETRLNSSDKESLDRLVLDAVSDLSSNPYSTVHDFKAKMQARFPQVIAPEKLNYVKAIWEMVFPGAPAVIQNTNFLSFKTPAKPDMQLSIVQEISPALAAEYGVPARNESLETYYQAVNINDTQSAIQVSNKETNQVPHWVVVDRKSLNILGVYDPNQKLMTEHEEMTEILSIATSGRSASGIIQSYKDKISILADFAQGKGTLEVAYKKKSYAVEEVQVNFNDRVITGRKIRIEMKRKLLAGLILGLPNIDEVELITIPGLDIKSLSSIEGQTVIGYKMKFETGTATEVILRQKN